MKHLVSISTKRDIKKQRADALAKRRAAIGKGKPKAERDILLAIFDAEQEQSDPYITDRRFSTLERKIKKLKAQLSEL